MYAIIIAMYAFVINKHTFLNITNTGVPVKVDNAW